MSKGFVEKMESNVQLPELSGPEQIDKRRSVLIATLTSQASE